MLDRIRFAEDEMPRMEDRMTALETALGNFTSAEESQRQTAELAALRHQHEALMSGMGRALHAAGGAGRRQSRGILCCRLTSIIP